MKRAIAPPMIGISLLLGSCAIMPDSDTIGPYPSGYKEIIKAHVLRTFFDPYSIRSASVSWPIQGHLYFQQGWIVCLEANAKNRMGGYVGIQKTAFLINRNVVVHTMDKATLCDGSAVNYARWPELEELK